VNLEALFWELASPDRMAILRLLSTGKRRLTRIAEEVCVTVQEAHRDLARLTKARLVTKDPQGYYALTPLGKYVMTLLEPLEALLEHRDYYAAHDLTRIPKNLLYRIGQLKGARQAPDTFTALSYAEILIKEAREYLWIVTEQVLPSAARLMQGKNIQIRIVIPRVQPPPSAEPLKLANLEARYIDQIAAALVINEKRAALALPRHNGEIDYRGLLIETQEGLEWCKDLFTHHWNKAKPI